MSGFLPVDVRGVVPMSAAVDAMAWAFEAVSLGLADMPTRIHMHPAGTDNTHIFMPVYLPDSPCGRYPAVITCKAVSIIPTVNFIEFSGTRERGVRRSAPAIITIATADSAAILARPMSF